MLLRKGSTMFQEWKRKTCLGISTITQSIVFCESLDWPIEDNWYKSFRVHPKHEQWWWVDLILSNFEWPVAQKQVRWVVISLNCGASCFVKWMIYYGKFQLGCWQFSSKPWQKWSTFIDRLIAMLRWSKIWWKPNWICWIYAIQHLSCLIIDKKCQQRIISYRQIAKLNMIFVNSFDVVNESIG
jgi:hypothetical protein